MNEAIFDFTADDFREVFRYSLFDFLNEYGINLDKIEDVFAHYQENKIAQSINMALSMVIERIVDKFLISQNILKEEELGTEVNSDFKIQVNPSTGKPCISSKYKLLYKGKNLKFIFDCQFDLNEIYYNEKVDSIIRKITEDLRNQLSE